MGRTLVSPLAACLVITGGAAPACAVDCAAKIAISDHAANRSDRAHEYHHHGSMPMDKGQESPNKQRPCGGDLHHGSVVAAAAAKASATLSGLPTPLTAWNGEEPFRLQRRALPNAFTREHSVLPPFGTTLSPLRI
jgi:hypothetical protein